MQNKILVVLVAAVIFQSSSLAVSASNIGPQCVPPRDCKKCPAGVVPRVVKAGCPGCPECCVSLPCAPMECSTGFTKQLNFQENGCPGCYTCVVSA